MNYIRQDEKPIIQKQTMHCKFWMMNIILLIQARLLFEKALIIHIHEWKVQCQLYIVNI